MRESASQIAPLNGMAIAPPYRWMLGGAEFIIVAGPQGKPINLAKGRRVIQPSGIAAPLGGATGLALNYSASPATGYTTETGLTKQPTEITLCAVYRLTALNGLRGLVGHFYGSANGWSLFHQDTTVLFSQVPTFVANPGVTYPGGIANTSHWYAIIGRSSVRYGSRLALRDLTTGAVVIGSGTHVALAAATSRQGTVGSDGPAEGDVTQGYFQMGGMWSRMWTDGQALEWLMDPYAFLRRKREPPPRYRAPGSGTIYTQSIDGGITPAGTLTRSTSRTLVASITAAGALTRQEQRAVSATITPTGVLAKQEQRSLAGAITPAAALSKSEQRALAGSITPAGIRSTSSARAIAAAITPAGTENARTARTIVAAITPAAVVLKNAGRALASQLMGLITTLVAQDSVTRADAGTPGTATELGGAWTVLQGGFGVSGGKLINNVNGRGMCKLGDAFDGAAKADMSSTNATTGTPGLFCRCSDNQNYIGIHFESTIFQIHVVKAGSFSLIGSTFASGLTNTPSAAQVTLDIKDQTLTVIVNGVQKAQVTLTAPAASLAGTGWGLYAEGSGALQTNSWDNYSLNSYANVKVGTLAKKALRALAGGLTPTATLARKWARSFAAGITASGTVSKSLARSLAAIITSLYGYIGRDGVARANSTTSLGTPEMGGAWTVRQNAAAWGVTNQRGYALATTGVSAIVTQTYATTPGEVGYDVATDAISTHVLIPVPLFVDTNNFLSVGMIAGAVSIATKVAGSSFTRVTVAQPSTGLPASGALSGTISVVTDKPTGVVQVLFNGTPIAGATYTLTSGEMAAFGSALQAGLLSSYISGTATASTFKNWYARAAVTNASLTRVVGKGLAGGITAAAALVRTLARALAGAMTPSAALVRNTARAFVGSITPSGTLSKIKGAALTLAGTLAPTALLGRLTGKTLSGVVTPSGVATKESPKHLAGELAPIGALQRTGARVYAAAIAPAGTIQRLALKPLAAALSPSGVLTRLLIVGDSAGRRLLALFRAIR